MNDFSTLFCAAIACSRASASRLGHRRRGSASGVARADRGGHDRVDQRGARRVAQRREHRRLVGGVGADVPARRNAVAVFERARGWSAPRRAGVRSCSSRLVRRSGVADQLFVGRGVEQRGRASPASAGFSRNSQAAYASSFTALGRARQRVVDGDDLAGDRRVDVGGGLHRFDDGAGLARRQLAADRGQLDEDEVAQRCLRVVGDADRSRCRRLRCAPIRATVGVPQIGGNVHAAPPVVDVRWRMRWVRSSRPAPCRCARTAASRRARRARLSRTTTCTVSPGATPRGQRARARSTGSSVGLNVPLVISPSPCVGVHGLVRAQHAALVEQQRARRAAAPADARRSAALPTKSRGLARSTVQARPDSSGDTVSSMSWP